MLILVVIIIELSQTLTSLLVKLDRVHESGLERNKESPPRTEIVKLSPGMKRIWSTCQIIWSNLYGRSWEGLNFQNAGGGAGHIVIPISVPAS